MRRRATPERKVAVVTGASAGVGRATARLFAQRGFDVALLARAEAGLAGAAAEVEAAGGRAFPIATDVARFDGIEQAAARIEDELGPIEVWVNEEMILEKNMMIESNLALTVASGLAESDLDVYRAPFVQPASRRPMLAWTREFPLDGEPAVVAELVRGYGRWMPRAPTHPTCS